MKKLLAVILSVICICSCFTVGAEAAGGNVLGEIANTFFESLLGTGMEEDTPLGYGVIYEIDSLSFVSVIYKPSPSISFENPGTYTITSDTPLSVDHEFICWEDSDGKKYYAGDKIYVDGMITLYAVWEEKDGNDVRLARVIKTTIEALKRLIGKFFGILKIIEDFEPVLPVPGEYDLVLNGMYYEDKSFGETEGDERILFYIDSQGIYEKTAMQRIDASQAEGASIYLCTGWDEATHEAIDRSEDYIASYYFAEHKGPNGEDVLVASTVTAQGDIVSSYINDKDIEDGKKFYMVVTVEDSLYSSVKGDNGLDYDEICHPVSCVFTLVK